MRFRSWATILAFGVLAVAMPATAQPTPATVSCEVLEITATNGKDPSVDADLEKLKKKFKKPPFSSWNQFKLLMKTDRTLTVRKADELKLKQGSATVTFLGVLNKSQVRLKVTIDDDKGKQMVDNTSAVDAGDYLVYGHSVANNDGHLLALTCK